MKRKILKCLSVFLAWTMCMPVWGATTFSGSQLTNLNAENYVNSHSRNIESFNTSGNNASVRMNGSTGWVRWKGFSIDSGKQYDNEIASGGRMYFIVEGGASSEIKGTIQNAAGANFYLINPAGISTAATASPPKSRRWISRRPRA